MSGAKGAYLARLFISNCYFLFLILAIFTLILLSLIPAVTYVESLKALLKETQGLSTDPKVTQKLGDAQKLVATLETVETGILNKFRLDGQVALVTGGGQGIGRAFSHALGEAGCKVAVVDLDLSRAEVVAGELKKKGIESIAIKVDVSKKADVQDMVKKVIDTFGDLHIACNNAGEENSQLFGVL